ncbi:hypothetical protein Ocin01_07619 [Orchesella cincta]|uniref:Uncharacterized protein n=1 Tax=Orchesella cincta TaxID=48709 RepID=A0A1D2N1B6_ORCCI|nr:hypothetical protein Ocin01_07619 [Orchesella cincta]
MFSSSNVRLGGRVWRLQKSVKEVQHNLVPSSPFSQASAFRQGSNVDRNSATQISKAKQLPHQSCNNRTASS